MHVGVAQNHQLRTGHVRVIGQRGFEFVLQVDDFFIAFHQRRNHHVAAVCHREVVRIRVAGGDPHRRGLDRFRHAGGRGEFPDLAVVGVVALPQRLDHRNHLTQRLTACRRRHAARHAVEFDLIRATGQTDFHAAVADHVQQGAFTGDPQRVPERRDDGACAQVNRSGLRGQVGEQRHRAGRNGVFHGVVFADPHGAEAALFGHQCQLGQVLEQLAVAD